MSLKRLDVLNVEVTRDALILFLHLDQQFARAVEQPMIQVLDLVPSVISLVPREDHEEDQREESLDPSPSLALDPRAESRDQSPDLDLDQDPNLVLALDLEEDVMISTTLSFITTTTIPIILILPTLLVVDPC